MRSLSALPTPLLALLATLHLPSALADGGTPEVKIETVTPVHCSRPTRPGDKISVHYRGTLESTGAQFDESYKRGRPITFTLGAGQVIRGWEEGLVDMCPGEGRILTIPPELAYGARGAPPAIPGGATLVFETELVDIVGVKQESLVFASTTTATSTEQMFGIATAPPEPPVEEEEVDEDDSPPALEATPLPSGSPMVQAPKECDLLGPLALFVKGALGLMALLALVYKRWRETPKRPWRIWFFDVSKQVFGSMLVHVLNVAMSMLGTGELLSAAKNAVSSASKDGGEDEGPNPCSYYLLNLGIDVSLPSRTTHVYLIADSNRMIDLPRHPSPLPPPQNPPRRLPLHPSRPS